MMQTTVDKSIKCCKRSHIVLCFCIELVSVAKAELATETGGLLSNSLPTLHKFRVSTAGGCKTTSRRLKESSGLIISAGCYRLPRNFFNVVREGDAVTFAVSDEVELHGWVQAIHRATGQSHKPVPPARISTSRTHFHKGGRLFCIHSEGF